MGELADQINSTTTDLARRRPSGLTSFVGRERELADLQALVVDPSARLITVTGAGGVGKTRLVEELLTGIGPAFPGGSYLIELAAIADPAGVAEHVLRSLGEERNAAINELDALAIVLGSSPTLLILDNMEQLVDAGPLVQEMLVRAPALTVLVTSRLLLRVRGEIEFALEPLSLEQQNGDIPAAVQLLLDRTRHGSGSAAMEAGVASRICARVDGLPLAIELAAAHLRLLGAEEVLQRLERRTPLPASGARDMPDRQRTMDAAVAWSVELLSAEERDLFMRLSVFSGGFDVGAGLALSGLLDEGTYLDQLDNLVAHNLIRRKELESGGVRFSMLETILAFGRKLVVREQLFDQIRQQHAAYYRQLARTQGPQLRAASDEQFRVWKLIESDIDNYRSAIEYFSTIGQTAAIADLVSALDWFWTDSHFALEGHRLLKAVVADPEATEDPAIAARALSVLAMLSDHIDDLEGLPDLIDRAIVAVKATDDDSELAGLLHLACGSLINQNRMNAARAKALETIAFATAKGAFWFIGAGEMNLSLIETLEGEYARARAAAERGLTALEACGDSDLALTSMNCIAYTWLFEGEYAKSQAVYQEVLVRQAERLEDTYFFQHVCRGIAAVSAKTGRYELAARLMGMAEGEHERSGVSLRKPLLNAYNEMLNDARMVLGEARFAELEAEGRAFPKTAGIQEIITLSEPPSRVDRALRPAPFNVLSNREFEVLLHLMAGQSDPEIAGVLFLSPRTVSQHVSSILNKLGVSSRTAAASMAAAANIR